MAIALVLSPKPEPSPVLLPRLTPLQQYSDHLCDVYLDEPDVHHSILPSKKVKFVEPVLLELHLFPSHSPGLDFPVRGDLDDVGQGGVQTNLSQLFNTPTGYGHRIFIQGRPGSGKTTLLKQVSKKWAEAKQANKTNKENLSGCVVMLLVCLRDLWSYPNPRVISVQDLFTSIGSKPFLKYDIGKLLTEVPEKQLCILLDGLDEYAPGYSEHSNYIHQIISGKELKKATVIVTSRPEALSVIPRNYELHQRVEIIGFNWEKVNQFVTSYYEGKETGRGDKLLQYLKDKKMVRFMCYLPLYLHMLIFINDAFMKLPVTPTEIYASFTLQTLREELKNIDENLLLTDQCLDLSLRFEHLASCSPVLSRRFAAICRLAYNGIYNVIEDSSATERPSVIAQFPKNSVPNILHNHSLGLLFSHQVIKPLGAIERVYTFQHLTFQQFLAAYHLSQMALTNQVDLIKHPYFPGNMSTFFCGLYGLAIQNESVLFTIVEHLLTDLYVDSFTLSVQCVYESQHSGAAIELLRHSKGKVTLTCTHYATFVLSSPTMTKASMFSYDESHFQTAMEYFFTEAHSSITELKLTEETCSCPTVKWQDVLESAPSLFSLSIITMSYCSEESLDMYLEIFSIALVKATHLEKVKVEYWPVATHVPILDRIQTFSNSSNLTQIEFICHYQKLLSITEMVGLLLDFNCRKVAFERVSVHCATTGNLTLQQPVSDHSHCAGNFYKSFTHLHPEPFLSSTSPGDRHCDNWQINLQDRLTNITVCGNQYLEEAIEWVIEIETAFK